jgi:hypothetical protein
VLQRSSEDCAGSALRGRRSSSLGPGGGGNSRALTTTALDSMRGYELGRRNGGRGRGAPSQRTPQAA